jgi:peptide/nickel transport system permease protein
LITSKKDDNNSQADPINRNQAGLAGFWRAYKKNSLGVIGLGLIVAFSLSSLLAPLISPYRPFGIDSRPLLAPSVEHPMGTDHLGRDVFAGILYGGRISMTVGILAALGATAIGVVVGAVAGYYGKIIDKVLMRTTEFFHILPSFLLALVLMAVLEPSFLNVILVIAVASWPYTARITRAQFLSLREREFVLAAIAGGRKNREIILSEIMPNAIQPVIVNASFLVADAILIETGLSFIGLGDQSLISWGYMMRNSIEYLREAWWMTVFPGLAVMFTAVAFNLVAFAINDVLNPRKERVHQT